MSERNPFFSVSTLPYQAPPFDVIDDSHYRPAFDEGVRQQRAEIRAIIDNPQPASFANTLEALEQSGQLLARVTRVASCLAWRLSGITRGRTRPHAAGFGEADSRKPALTRRPP